MTCLGSSFLVKRVAGFFPSCVGYISFWFHGCISCVFINVQVLHTTHLNTVFYYYFFIKYYVMQDAIVLTRETAVMNVPKHQAEI